MAILKKSESSFVLPPQGSFHAVISDVKDMFGVKRKVFGSNEEETVDLTQFFFEFKHQGKIFKVASKKMKISGHERSALFQFLKTLLGRNPKYGWDYCELKGKKVVITIDHVEGKNGQKFYELVSAVLAPSTSQQAVKKQKVIEIPQPPEEEIDEDEGFIEDPEEESGCDEDEDELPF